MAHREEDYGDDGGVEKAKLRRLEPQEDSDEGGETPTSPEEHAVAAAVAAYCCTASATLRVAEAVMELPERWMPNSVAVTCRDRDGRTAFYMCAMRAHGSDVGPCVAAMKRLLACGADIDARRDDGRTALHAVYRRDSMELLLAAGADIDTQDRAGTTPLMFNVWKPDEARLLLEHGANVDLVNQWGETALDQAVKPEVRALLECPPPLVIPWTAASHWRFRAPFHSQVFVWLCIAKRLDLPRDFALLIPAWLAASYKFSE